MFDGGKSITRATGRGGPWKSQIFGPKVHSLRSLPFQGPKKSWFPPPPPSNGPWNWFSPIKIITSCAIQTTGTLILRASHNRTGWNTASCPHHSQKLLWKYFIKYNYDFISFCSSLANICVCTRLVCWYAHIDNSRVRQVLRFTLWPLFEAGDCEEI